MVQIKQCDLIINIDAPIEAPGPQLFDLLRSPQNENTFTKLRIYNTQSESDTTIAALKEVLFIMRKLSFNFTLIEISLPVSGPHVLCTEGV